MLFPFALQGFAQNRIQFEPIGYNKGISHLSVNAIYQDSAGFMWFSTVKGLCRYDGTTCKVFKQIASDSTSLPHDETTFFFDTKEEGFGAYIPALRKGTRFHALTETFTIIDIDSSKLNIPLPSTPFVLSDGSTVELNLETRHLIRTFKDGSNHRTPLPSPITPMTYYAHLEHHDQLWIATTVGLFMFDSKTGTFDLYQHDPDNPASIAENSVRYLYKDREDNVWLATYGGGVAKAISRNVLFKTFQPSPNNPNAVVGGLLFGICEDKDGNLWIGSENDGLSQYIVRERKFITHRHDPNNPNTPRADNYRALFCDSDGKIWAGKSVFNPTTKQWRYFPATHSRENVKSYLEIADTVYAFSFDTVYAVHRQTLKVSSFAIDMPGKVFGGYRTIRCCFKNRQGQVLIGTQHGFAELDLVSRHTKHWRLQPPTPSVLGYGHIQAIYQTEDGRYWVGTRGGGLFIFNEQFELIEHKSVRNAFPDDVVYDILEDENGLLWMTTNSGLVQLDPATQHVTRVFTVHDGLLNNEFNHHCFTKLKTGEFAGGGIGGFFIFNPNHLKRDSTTLSVVLTDFKVFEKSYPLDSAILFKRDITLDHTKNFFALSFSACSYKNPDAIEYAYMLDGVDNAWIETQSGTARYNSVPHGEYIFRVKARLGNASWGDVREIRLSITPPFWRTAWFTVGALLTMVMLIVLMVSIIIRRKVRAEREAMERQEELKRTREATLLAERERISADMHDEIGAMLTNITMIAEQLKQHPKNLPTDVLNMLAVTAREATQGVRAIVWSMNPRYDSLDAFAAYLREKMHQQLEAAPIELTIDFPDALPPMEISGEMRHNLFLAVREALNNVVKHSHATHAHLSMRLEGEQLTIIVQDNGVGIEQKETFGNGTHFMQRRLKKIGGECWITSEKGNGTQVRFQVSLTKRDKHETTQQ
ncbi:MAG: two-component regulator propeller domain-containing protein [Chloroherpetonaceae bacterium]